jgi:predicted glycosyltransferase
MTNQRVLFYSHDTFGLGHIRRTQKLANEIAENGRSILIACSSPKASDLSYKPGVQTMTLPGFMKLNTGEYVPRNMNVPVEEFVKMRSDLLKSVINNFQPDYVVIDKEPLGVKKELLPALEELKIKRPSCQVICGFRDILDEKKAVYDEWKSRETRQALEKYFDHILIYGEQEYFDFAKEYDLPNHLAKKLRYVGYVSEGDVNGEDPLILDFAQRKPLVTFTLGGGEDGGPFLEIILNLLENDLGLPFNSFVLSGPFISSKLIDRVFSLSFKRSDARGIDFTPRASDVFKQSDLIVSMGGYNSMIEIMAMGKPLLVYPRTHPRKEQLIRAEIFKKHGFCEILKPDQLGLQSLKESIVTELGKTTEKRKFLSVRGLEEFKKIFKDKK